MHTQGFPGSSDSKESICNARDLGLIPGLGKSFREGNGYPLQYSCLGEFHGQRSLVGYSPWCNKESETAEKLIFHFTFNPYFENLKEESMPLSRNQKEGIGTSAKQNYS